MESIRYRSRVLIIGSGLAGCTAALVLADQGHEVSLLTPADELDGGNSTVMVYDGETLNTTVSIKGDRRVPTAFIVK